MKNKKWLITILAAVIAGSILTACAEPAAPAPEGTTSATAERPGILNAFESTDIDSNAVTQKIFSEKKLTMVNIWATFCGPCIREMPDLKKLNDEYSDKGFQVIGIPVDLMNRNGKIDESLLQDARDIISKTGADYLHILPSKSLNQAKLNEVYSVPETIFVDRNGNQVGKSYLGSRTKKQWAKIVDTLLEQVK